MSSPGKFPYQEIEMSPRGSLGQWIYPSMLDTDWWSRRDTLDMEEVYRNELLKEEMASRRSLADAMNPKPPSMPRIVTDLNGNPYAAELAPKDPNYVFAADGDSFKPGWHRKGTGIPDDFKIRHPEMPRDYWADAHHNLEIGLPKIDDNGLKRGIWTSYAGYHGLNAENPSPYHQSQVNGLSREQLENAYVNAQSHRFDHDPSLYSPQESKIDKANQAFLSRQQPGNDALLNGNSLSGANRNPLSAPSQATPQPMYQGGTNRPDGVSPSSNQLAETQAWGRQNIENANANLTNVATMGNALNSTQAQQVPKQTMGSQAMGAAGSFAMAAPAVLGSLMMLNQRKQQQKAEDELEQARKWDAALR